MKNTERKIEFTRVNNDGNGNPRYVCHFLSLLNSGELSDISIHEQYSKALKRAKTIDGKKFHNNQYGGGVVFQSYNIEETEKQINELLK